MWELRLVYEVTYELGDVSENTREDHKLNS